MYEYRLRIESFAKIKEYGAAAVRYGDTDVSVGQVRDAQTKNPHFEWRRPVPVRRTRPRRKNERVNRRPVLKWIRKRIPAPIPLKE